MDQWTSIFNEQEKEFRDGAGEIVNPGTDSTKRPPAEPASPTPKTVVHAAAADALLKRVQPLLDAIAGGGDVSVVRRRRAHVLLKQIQDHLRQAPPPEATSAAPPPPNSPDGPTPASASRAASEPAEAAPTPEDSSERGTAIAEAFVAWCNRGGAMLSRYYMFERELQNTAPDAQVIRIHYDARTNDRFKFDVSDASGEFWLVEQASEAVLLPMPKRDGTFRALDPAFTTDGEPPAPSDLYALTPARLESAEGGYRLRASGHLHTTASSSTS